MWPQGFRKSFLPQSGEHLQLYLLWRNSSKVWLGRENQCSRINTLVAYPFLREKVEGIWELILLFCFMFSLYQKNTGHQFKPKVSPQHDWHKNVISQFSDKTLIMALRTKMRGKGYQFQLPMFEFHPQKKVAAVYDPGHSSVLSSVKWEQ